MPVAVSVDVLKILCAGNEARDAPVIAQEKRERGGKSEKKVGRVENINLSQLPRCDERNGDDKWGTRTLKKVADDEF